MPLVAKDRVQETSTTTGTGTLTLGGAVTGYQTFSSAIGNGNTCYYAIDGGSEWEVGLGTVGAGTLARNTVLESSNSGSLVNLSAGTKNVFCTYPAEKSLYLDASGNVGIGTNSPATKVDILGSAPADTIRCRLNNSSTTASSSADYLVYAGDGSSYAQFYAIQGTGSYGGLAFTNLGCSIDVAQAYPIKFATNNTERMRIDSSGYVTNAVNGLGNGRVQAYQYYRLNAGLAGANVNTAQNTFGVGVTLVASTVYEFEIVVALSKSAGTTSHTFAVGFGGTATLNNIAYSIVRYGNTTSFATETTSSGYFIQTAASTVLTGAITSANVFQTLVIKGTVSINGGGTLIPQYTLSAAPGGAYTTAAGSYIKISPLSASGSNTSIGSWA